MAAGDPVKLRDLPAPDEHRSKTIWLLTTHIEYTLTMEHALVEMAAKRESELQDRKKSGDVEFHNEGMSHEEAVHIYHFDFAFKDKLRYSAIILLYSIWETRTKALCSEIQKRFETPFKLRDFRGSTFERCKLYFTKAVPVDITQWQTLEALQKVRDCIVHAGGVVNGANDPQFLNALPRQYEGIDIIDGSLHIEPQVHKTFFQAVRDFFDTIFRCKNFGPCYAPFPRWSDEVDASFLKGR